MDCFVKGFHFLSTNVDRKAIIQPKPEKALEFAQQQYNEAVSILENVTKSKPTYQQKDQNRSFPKFPCILAILGSGGAFVKVGPYKVVPIKILIFLTSFQVFFGHSI